MKIYGLEYRFYRHIREARGDIDWLQGIDE